MLESLHIQNFRVLRQLQVTELARINLIAGLNNSGKTSLLEALFLLCGGGRPEYAVNVNVMRGIEHNVEMVPSVGEAQWKEFFSDLDLDNPIEVAGHHDVLGSLKLQMTSELPEKTQISPEESSAALTTSLPDQRILQLRYTDSSGNQTGGIIRARGDGVEITRHAAGVSLSGIILSSRIGSTKDDAERLGILRKRKRGHLLLEALRVVEPNLQSIEDSVASGVPMIWGDVGLSEMIPLSVMGEGMIRTARLVLAISSVPGGLALVDELENGLHHTVLPKVWQVVEAAAEQFDVQVFATTHSLECIGAAHEALDVHSFRLHRLEAVNGTVQCITYAPESMGAAILHGVEVR